MPPSLTSLSKLRVAHEPPPSESARGAVRAGWIIVLLFFGGFGGWAMTAPLNGAVVANAVVKVEGNRKSVQHLDGGIVKELRVKEGDRVKAGDVLAVLDDTETRAEYDVLRQQATQLRATQARLEAELAGASEVTFPADLLSSSEPFVQAALQGQRSEFETGRAAIDGQKESLGKKIAELEEQITGSRSQLAAYRDQRQSVVAEQDSLQGLLKEGLIARSRMLQLERTQAGLEGQIGTTEAAIAAARRSVEELQQQIAQIGADRAAEVSKDLRDAEAKLLDVTPRLRNAQAALSRMQIRAPYSGEVVGLDVFGVGAVVGRGQKILDIVPDGSALVVEAQVHVEDIGDIHPGMAAEVHFTSYKQRTVPLIHGTVGQVSADRLADQRTGAPYYLATVNVDEEELAASPEIKLYPGMPATVMVTTKERTALDYLAGPLVASFDRSFRQK